MGGPKKSNLSAEQSAYQQQLEQGKRLADQSQQMLDTQKAYQAPLVNFTQRLISGDMNAKLQAVAPAIGEITRGTQQAREGILDTAPAGAARDFALAGLKRDAAAQKSGFLNNVFLQAFPTLAGLGQQDAGIGLQELGGSLRASEGGAQGLGAINTRDANAKASTLGMIGGIAGGVGKAAVGAFNPLSFLKPATGFSGNSTGVF